MDTTTESMSKVEAGAEEQFTRFLGRFSRLTAEGKRLFFGRLIEGGTEKPAITAEFDRALQKLETDPDLRKCWNGWDQDADRSCSVSGAGSN